MWRPRSSLSRVALLITLCVCTQLALPRHAWAGMPSISLSDAARLRMDTISFFLMGLLLSAWFVQWLWNSLSGDFPRLPQLSYRRALSLVCLWGLLFVIVLTMISGARELMTPGAWQKQGWTYRLAQDAPADQANEVTRTRQEALLHLRHRQLERLWDELMKHAAVEDGEFLSADGFAALPAEVRLLPEMPAVEYRYVTGLTTEKPEEILAFEPAVYGDEPLVLLVSGAVQPMSTAELRETVPRESVR